jgi:hypothetical protein
MLEHWLYYHSSRNKPGELVDISSNSRKSNNGPEKGQDTVVISPCPTTPYYQAVYSLTCVDPQRQFHTQFYTGIYEDEPRQAEAAEGQTNPLEGKVRIRNLIQYLSVRPHVCFIVAKQYNCDGSDTDIPMVSSPGNLVKEKSDIIRMSSEILHEAIKKVAKFEPNGLPHRDLGPRVMWAPYLFLFHHRAALKSLCD